MRAITSLQNLISGNLLLAGLLVLAPAATMAQAGKNVLFKATVVGAPPEQKVYLFTATEFNLKKVDSVRLKGNSLVFIRSKDFKRGLYNIGPAANQNFQVILGESGLTATIKHPAWSETKVVGGKENKLYKEYQAVTNRTNSAIERIQSDFNQEAKAGFTNPVEQQDRYGNARRRTDSAYKAMDAALTAIATANPRAFMGKVSAYLAAGKDDFDKTYLKEKDFQDPELLNGDWIRSKISLWLQRFIPLDLSEWQKAAREAIERSPKGSEGREHAYGAVVSIFYPIDQDFTRLIVRDWVKDQPNSTQAGRIVASLPPASPGIGEMAPDIILKDSTGKDIALSSLRGKYVMIDFWASWCGPCRAENPNVTKAYAKYKDKGFTIYSVSLDASRDKWIQAIKKDNLSWPSHVSDLKAWNSAGAKLYRVSSIPATFMVDKEGKVVAHNLRGDKLESFLATAFESKP